MITLNLINFVKDKNEAIMPEICRFYGIIIKMFFRDHNPPHFHAEYGNYEAIFDIQTLYIIEGELPNRAKLLVIEWAILHRKELLNNWEKATRPDSIDKIEPLN